MKSLLLILSFFMFLTATSSAQIKNAKTESVKISGNCGMCETTIEKSGSAKRVAQVDWDRDTKMASITYDASKTSKDEILKRIALAGYDNESYLAPDAAYASLHGCCQYEREFKMVNAQVTPTMPATNVPPDPHAGHHAAEPVAQQAETRELQPVFNAYFALKDALIKSDQAEATAKAKLLVAALQAVNMGHLENEEHTQWMKLEKSLGDGARQIADTRDLAGQRETFAALSENMYHLMKASDPDTPVYYQHCPMYNDGKGANWLSKESSIKNPYYGSMMLTCGKTVETLQ